MSNNAVVRVLDYVGGFFVISEDHGDFSPVEAFGYGLLETCTSLLINSPIIALGTGVCAAGAFFLGGPPLAYVAAAISSFILSLFYGLGHSEVTTGMNTRTTRACRVAGNIVPIFIAPAFFFWRVF